MPRATTGKVHHKRAKKILKDAKGFRGSRSKLFRTAKDARRRALENSYKHRKVRKRDFRSLWISRINAAVRTYGISYSSFINSLKKSKVEINRKMLAELAVSDSHAFEVLVKEITA